MIWIANLAIASAGRYSTTRARLGLRPVHLDMGNNNPLASADFQRCALEESGRVPGSRGGLDLFLAHD